MQMKRTECTQQPNYPCKEISRVLVFLYNIYPQKNFLGAGDMFLLA
jgi:hypothetical protein